ncbi:hypothetical protein FOA52_000755 [Chlamydomonas sp. UWO 241]|nr:hypothetical protein FOA52_000755 [Chlamydomonas sp. UWO 241]
MILMLTEDEIAERASAALLGALVADAATMGLHWVYNQSEIAELVSQRSAAGFPEFLTPPASKYYNYESGAFSPYGDELLPVAQFLADHGKMDDVEFSKFLAAYYNTYPGRLNKSSKGMAAAVTDGGKTGAQAGSSDPDDNQANGMVKVPALILRYAARPGLSMAVSKAVGVQQSNAAARDAAVAVAVVLEKVVMGAPVKDALMWAATHVQQTGARSSGQQLISHAVQDTLQHALKQAATAESELRKRRSGPSAAAGGGLLQIGLANGLSCSLPGALANAVAGAALAEPLATAIGGGGGNDGQARFRAAIRANMLAGGDSAARAIVIGALLAAEGGIDSIPPEWIARTSRYAEVATLAARVAARRRRTPSSAE